MRRRDGWLAVAALERHFQERLAAELGPRQILAAVGAVSLVEEQVEYVENALEPGSKL